DRGPGRPGRRRCPPLWLEAKYASSRTTGTGKVDQGGTSEKRGGVAAPSGCRHWKARPRSWRIDLLERLPESLDPARGRIGGHVLPGRNVVRRSGDAAGSVGLCPKGGDA